MDTSLLELTARLEQKHWWFRARRQILLDIAIELLPKAKTPHLLDIGCCIGGNVAALSRYYDCVGVDKSPYAIALARQRYPHLNFLCRQAPEDLEGIIERTSVFLLADVLEHIEWDGRTLAGLVSRAMRGAHFLITVPADMSLWSIHDETHGHFRRYDLESLPRLWGELPVHVCLLSYFNARLRPMVKWMRMIEKWRGMPFGHSNTDLRMPPEPINWLLERIFSGERGRLLKILRGVAGVRYYRGVSLIAVLRRV